MSFRDLLTFEVVAWSASTTNVGLVMDNIQVTAAVVPEPSSALMMLLGGMVLAFRSRRFVKTAV